MYIWKVWGADITGSVSCSPDNEIQWMAINKGQVISEWNFDVLNFPKNQQKNLMNFCPRI